MTLQVTHRVQKLNGIGRHNLGNEKGVDLINKSAVAHSGCERSNDRNDHRRVSPSKERNLEIQRSLLALIMRL
jgi:hypothetical protein